MLFASLYSPVLVKVFGYGDSPAQFQDIGAKVGLEDSILILNSNSPRVPQDPVSLQKNMINQLGQFAMLVTVS